MTATDVTGFDAIFSTGIIRYFLQVLGELTKLRINTREKAKKSSGEPPMESVPRNGRFLSLVVVELVLKLIRKLFMQCNPGPESNMALSMLASENNLCNVTLMQLIQN